MLNVSANGSARDGARRVLRLQVSERVMTEALQMMGAR